MLKSATRLAIAILLSGLVVSAAAQTTTFTSFVNGSPTASAPLGSGDYLPVTQGGVTKKYAGSNLVTLTDTQTLTNKTLSVANGSTSAPTIYGTTDTTTGLAFPSANTMLILRGGAVYGTLNASGIGFGGPDAVPTGPDREFFIKKDQNTSTSLVIENENTGSLAEATIHGFSDVTGFKISAFSSGEGADVNYGCDDGNGACNILNFGTTALKIWNTHSGASLYPSAFWNSDGSLHINRHSGISTPGWDGTTQLIVENPNTGSSAASVLNVKADVAGLAAVAYSSGAGGGNANRLQLIASGGGDFIISNSTNALTVSPSAMTFSNTVTANAGANFGNTATGATNTYVTFNGGNTAGAGVDLILRRNGTAFFQLGNCGLLTGATDNDTCLVPSTGQSLRLYANGTGTNVLTLLTTGNLVINGTAAVTCAVGALNPVTARVTNGIITAC